MNGTIKFWKRKKIIFFPLSLFSLAVYSLFVFLSKFFQHLFLLSTVYDVRQASNLRGAEARRWFAKQLILPEWMIDVPSNLSTDWYVFGRPAGKRCFVVSSDGTTVSKLCNGILLHRFPSALPNGARINNASGSAQSYSVLDCIFHEPDQTYYVIEMVCWAGFSLYECTAEFRFIWLNSKLVEVGACDVPSTYHKFRFSAVPIFDCDQKGLQTAYTGKVPYVKDSLGDLHILNWG